jgi:hypothetical protein
MVIGLSANISPTIVCMSLDVFGSLSERLPTSTKTPGNFSGAKSHSFLFIFDVNNTLIQAGTSDKSFCRRLGFSFCSMFFMCSTSASKTFPLPISRKA